MTSHKCPLLLNSFENTNWRDGQDEALSVTRLASLKREIICEPIRLNYASDFETHILSACRFNSSIVALVLHNMQYTLTSHNYRNNSKLNLSVTVSPRIALNFWRKFASCHWNSFRHTCQRIMTYSIDNAKVDWVKRICQNFGNF